MICYIKVLFFCSPASIHPESRQLGTDFRSAHTMLSQQSIRTSIRGPAHRLLPPIPSSPPTSRQAQRIRPSAAVAMPEAPPRCPSPRPRPTPLFVHGFLLSTDGLLWECWGISSEWVSIDARAKTLYGDASIVPVFSRIPRIGGAFDGLSTQSGWCRLRTEISIRTWYSKRLRSRRAVS